MKETKGLVTEAYRSQEVRVVSKDLRGDMEAETERIRRSQPCRDGRTFQAKGTACIKTRRTCHFKYLKAGI